MTDLPLTAPLAWTGDDWEGRVTLPSWAGGLPDRDVSADGSAPLNVRAPAAGPTAAQFAAVLHLLDHEAEVAGVVRAALFGYYPEQRELTIDAYDGEDAEAVAEELPVLTGPTGIPPLVGLSRVIVHDFMRDGVAYVGFQFRCRWDNEHGCGVALHRLRVVDVGDAYTGWNSHTAWSEAEK